MLHLGTNIFLVPARRRAAFWDRANDGEDNFFHLISIPPGNIPLIVAGYGGEYYDLTAAELSGRQYATTEHPFTGETSRAVLRIAMQLTEKGYLLTRGGLTSFVVSLQPQAGAGAPIFNQFDYYARNEVSALHEFLDDQGQLLTLPGAV